MKTKIFTLGIAIFLTAFLAQNTALQAQIPEGGIVKDSLYVWDDFLIEGDVLTNDNGSTGSGWTDKWTYQTGHTSGVTVENGSITGIKGGFGISRDLINSIPLEKSTFYLAFVVNKTATGDFRIAGNRADGVERYAVGVKANGGLFGNIANTQITGDAGAVENNINYLVVAKWWYEGQGKMNISAFKAGEAIPIDEPTAGAWDFEQVGNITGVPIDYFRIAFASETVTLHDFKVGDSWKSVIGDTLLILPDNLEIRAISSTAAKMTWLDNSFHEDGFKIYLNGAEVGTVGANVSEFEITGLTDGTSYTFGVSAYNGSVETAKAELTTLFELDLTPPAVIESYPENNATDIDETSDIVIKFSEIMNTASVEGAITVNPALTNAQYTWQGDTLLTITADDMNYATVYTVSIGTTATDLSGNKILEEYMLSFTTAAQDLTPPTITEISPSNNAMNVLITSSIAITFSEGMDKASVEGAIIISPAVANIKFNWASDTKVIVIGDKLATETLYSVTIGTGAKDIKGNNLAAEETISFTTGASKLMLYDDFSIPDGVLANNEGISGAGWDGAWKYPGAQIGVIADNGHLNGGTATSVVRKINFPFAIASTTYYMSFLAHRSEDGAFDIFGGRFFNGVYQFRTGVGVNADGSLRFRDHTGNEMVNSPNAGTFEPGKTYLVILKHTPKVIHQVKLFKLGDPVNEPGQGEWDYEFPQGNTGVSMDYVGIIFNNAASNIDELKVGLTWEDVSKTTITDIGGFPLSAPGNLKISANSPSTAELVWSDNCVVEEGFKIYKNGTEIATVGENESSFKLRGLKDGETITIGISAFKGTEQTSATEISYTFSFDAENYVNTEIEIAKITSAPVIDGVVDDVWSNAFKNPIKKFNPSSEAPPIDEFDYKAYWRAMWDNNKFYLLFEVSDETFVFNDGSGTDIGQHDGFDLPMAAGANGTWTMNRLNLIAPEGGDTTLYIHEGMAAVKNAEKAFKFTETGYTIELSIVLRDFDDNIGLIADGYQFRIDPRYNDNDSQTTRDAQYTWTNKIEAGWVWSNVNSLGLVTLTESVDFTSPSITLTNPANASTGVAINTEIAITFSEAMDKESVEGSISVSPALTNSQFIWNGDNRVTISADNLEANTNYTVTIGIAASDVVGNWLPEELSFSFTTGEEIGIESHESRKISVFVSENGSILNFLNYEGRADIYSITGSKVQSIQNTSQPVSIASLIRGIYIVKTEKGAFKFIK